MKETKEELYNIGLEYIERSVQSHVMHIGINLYRIIKESFIKKYLERKELLLKMCGDSDLTWIKKFLRFPQISNLIIAYLQYLLDIKIYNEYAEIDRKPEFVIGDIVSYVTKVICDYFADRPEQEIVVIRDFLEILAISCAEVEFGDVVISNVNSMDGIFFFKGFSYSDELIEKNVHKSVKKLREELQKRFIPQIPGYNSVKEIYLKTLKQSCKMQFVYLLGDCKFEEFYIPPIILNSRYNRNMKFWGMPYQVNDYGELREEWKSIFAFDDIIYIVGGPGFGKSLFLRYLINNITNLNVIDSNERLVIYCDLKTFYTRGNKCNKSILDFLQESMIDITGIDEEKISKDFIQYYLDLGRCIILLDALDEVPKEKREELHKKIVAFFTTCSNSNNKICITSRDRGFLPKEEIEVFEICPLTTMDIEEYIDKMIQLKKFKKGDKKHFMDQAKILIDKNFLNNFLALSLLVHIYRAENKLPENKTNLYKKCFEYIAKEREIEEKDGTGFNWANVAPLMKDSTFISLSTLGVPNNNDVSRKDVEKLLLEQYKIKFNNEAETECAIKEFLDFCSSRTELFVPSTTDDKFKFFHRSFFEYFYSRYIYQCATVEEMYDLMNKFDVDSEVFELTVALVKEDNETKYQKLVMYLFQKAEECLNDKTEMYIAFHILTLAMQVIDDAYFKQRYFELVINNVEKLTTNQVKDINNRLIFSWMINAIECKDDNLEMFRVAYEKKCIAYVFSIFSSLKKNRIFNLELKASSVQEKLNVKEEKLFDYPVFSETPVFMDIKNYTLFDGRATAPFYVYVYKHYFNIFEKLESFNKMPIKKVLELLGVSPYIKLSTIKRGVSVYKSADAEARENICKAIMER